MSRRVRRVVTSREGGSSVAPYATFNLAANVGDDPAAVRANRERLARLVGLPADRLTWMDQVHGAEVAVLDGPVDGPVPGTDGLVTAVPRLALAVLVADCVPVLLADPTAAVVAAVHAGRAGAAAGVVGRAVQHMRTLGAQEGQTDVLLGPAICGQCYEVPAEMRDEVEASLPGSAATSRHGTPALDLRAGVARQLAELGVTRVVVDPRCTREDQELYSHRRDGATGRQAGLVWIDV